MFLSIRLTGSLLLTLLFCTPLFALSEQGKVYSDFGVFAYEDGDYADAVKNFKIAETFDPENPYTHQYLGKTYLKMERYEEALAHLCLARSLDATLTGLSFDLATVHLKRGEWAEAASLFSDAARANPDDVLAGYYAGISLLKIEDYSGALAFLLPAAERSPTIKDNGYYYAGICYLKTDRFDKAIETLEYVRVNAASEPLRHNAARWLAAARTRQSAMKPYALFAQASYKYDSNVLLEPIDQDLPTEQSDSGIEAFLSGQYDIIKTPSVVVGAGYSHYHQDYFRLQNFDFSGSIPRVYARYRLTPVTVSLTYAPNYYWLGGKDYLMKHQVRPEILWDIADGLRVVGAFTYENRNFFTTGDRSGDLGKFDGDLSWKIPGDMVRVFGGGYWETATAKSAAQNYHRYQGRAGADLALPLSLKLRLTGLFTRRDYDNVDPAFGARRMDTLLEGRVKLSRELFFDWLTLSAEYWYARNDSNIVGNGVDVFDYVRHQSWISVGAAF